MVPWERGRSLHCKSQSDLQSPVSPGIRHLGSQSFAPGMAHPCSRSNTPSRQHSHSWSSTPNHSHCRDSTPHSSRKQLVARPLRPSEVTPTQSQAQKTPKLKSLVQRAPTTKNYWDPPYRALRTHHMEFVQYVMGTLDRKAYDTEIRSLMSIFSSQASVLAHRVITSTITTLVATHRGVHFLTPFIPMELTMMPPNPTDVEPPGPLVHSDNYQTNVRVKCIREWTYLMCLLQYWYDAGTVYTYRGPVWQESKLML